jgi:glutamyl-tRNA synthetase
VADWRAEGCLPEAVVNYLARLGYPWPHDRLLSLNEFASAFDVARMSTSQARLDEDHLGHWQRLALEALDADAFAAWAGAALEGVPDAKRDAFIATVRPNVTSPGEVEEWARLVFTADEAVPVVAPEADSALFEAVLDAWEKHGPDLKALAAEAKSATGAKGRAFFHPLRLALTGREHGPELGALLTLIPDEIVRGRLARCRDA